MKEYQPMAELRLDVPVDDLAIIDACVQADSSASRRGRFPDFLTTGVEAMNLEALSDLMDGKGELAGAIANQELYIKRLVDQLRFQHEVLAEIHYLADFKSKTPLSDRDLIRIKAEVALRAASKSGLLS